MTTTRWTLTLTTVALGTLAAIDVRHDPAGHTSVVVHGKSDASTTFTLAKSLVAAVDKPSSLGTSKQSACPSDMAEVAGEYCTAPEQICDEYISEKRDRCERFRQNVRCVGRTSPKHFCVDRFEYPNEAGRRPTVAVTWDEARDLCANEGKRLCEAEEWTLACEGPQLKPYPFGFVRDATACNIDKPYLIPDNFAYDDPGKRAEEIARVSQSEPSGSREHCVSDYGVYDMTGNVDEWVLNEHGSPQGPEFQSGLKGGYWGPVRNRCRPMTTDHNHWHHGYQIGFRCCKDASNSNVAMPSGAVDNLPGSDEPATWVRPEAQEPSRS